MELKIYLLLQVMILLSVPYIEATQSILEIIFGQSKTDFQILNRGKPWLTQNTSKSSEILNIFYCPITWSSSSSKSGISLSDVLSGLDVRTKGDD